MLWENNNPPVFWLLRKTEWWQIHLMWKVGNIAAEGLQLPNIPFEAFPGFRACYMKYGQCNFERISTVEHLLTLLTHRQIENMSRQHISHLSGLNCFGWSLVIIIVESEIFLEWEKLLFKSCSFVYCWKRKISKLALLFVVLQSFKSKFELVPSTPVELLTRKIRFSFGLILLKW